MKIPDIKARLLEIASEIGNPEIAELAEALSRRPPTRRAPKTSRAMTPELKAEIVAFERRNPSLSQAAIGRRFNVNAGRVSEAVAGMKT